MMHISSPWRRFRTGALSLIMAGLVLPPAMRAQTRPPVGIRQNTPAVHAFTNARIVVAPGHTIAKGTLVIRDGVIEAVGENVTVPADARIWDLSGMTVYPGLIDSYSDIGMPKKAQPAGPRMFGGGGAQQSAPETQGVKHWNDNVQAAQHAEEIFTPDDKSAEKMRGMGFTAALLVPQKGLFHGTSALFTLGEGTPSALLVRPRVAEHIGFETSFGEGYPNSLMGAIALIRQTFLDAQWQRSALEAAARYPGEHGPEFVDDLAALADAIDAKQPVVFESADEIAELRAAGIAKEFSLKYIVRGSGTEYRRLDAVKKNGAAVILPVNFPDPPSVETQEDALSVGLEDLRYWDEAPENPKRLQEAGVTFVFTSATLKDPGKFLGNVRKAVDRGLPRDAALAALTTIPARLFGVDKKLGSIEPAKMASFVITDGDLFAEKTKVRETWIDGRRYEVKPQPEYDPRGTWRAALTDAPADSIVLILKGEADAIQGSAVVKGKEAKLATSAFSDMRIAFSFTGDSLGMAGMVRFSGDAFGETMVGTGELASGRTFRWTANRTEAFKPEADTSKPKPPQMASFRPVYPPGAFGREKLPERPAHVFVRGATIWTSGPQGILENADLIVENGKVLKVGRGLSAPADAVVIDAAGKHVTSGIIDCHSHTAAAGSVNETGKTMTPEVRIGDVIDCDDVALYRELAGGLTVANVLHGSANPIGGQNQVIKLRWGMLPEEMKFEGAMPGIKFALGENVKQSGSGRGGGGRYPQTRQGVEQIIRDEFQAALDYKKAWKEFHDGARKIPPRRNLQAETIAEVLEGKRLVHAHSYRQDEILMLMRVAEEFGFRIATFQHILEGYKVADIMAKHGAGGSSFSDWWAYKFEVYDAIPYNGALMHDAGVVVSYNSDSDELARRLNTEAAKAVKYGGVTPEEALKFVTINPAKQLRIDGRVGSLEPGKDADFVVWSTSPLSSYTVCEQTWIDGRKFFDRDEDRAMNEEVAKERAVLIQKILGAKKEGGGERRPERPKRNYSCHEEDYSGKEGY